MNAYRQNLLELDVKKLFVEHKIDEIVEIEKLLDAEIERKRNDLRSMVGDRYKDILTASESIKNMQNISEKIVRSIQNISTSSEAALKTEETFQKFSLRKTEEKSNNERSLAIQIRLAICVNEEIWFHLDKEDNLNSAQLYLLGQNIQTGLKFFNPTYVNQVPLLKHLNLNLTTLRDIILDRIIKKLEAIELTAEQTCSNLNGLMLLQNQNTSELISIFMAHRKTALSTVINITHPSVRVQISAMVKCLITTIHLLYDCFMCSTGSKKGLIFEQMERIVSESSEPTLSKLKIPPTPLDSYIPEIVRKFRPKCSIPNDGKSSKKDLIEKWLEDTKEIVRSGLCKSLELVTNIKGLYIIREEVLKIDLPETWEVICDAVGFPKNFDVWQYFFQELVTERAKSLLSSKVENNMVSLKKDVEDSLEKSGKFEENEADLRDYIWTEDGKDVGLAGNPKMGLSLKSMGFSPTIVGLCERLDEKFLDILSDLSQYLYGEEYNGVPMNTVILTADSYKRKFVDVEVLQKRLVQECVSLCYRLTEALTHLVRDDNLDEMLRKTIFCIRLLQAVLKLCPHFKKCCSINNVMEEWHGISNHLNEKNVAFWNIWIDHSVERTNTYCLEQFQTLDYKKTLSLFLKWDSIEIQEQTEDKVFKSQISVPLKPSAILGRILDVLNENLCCVLPHTLPKAIHVRYIERNVEVVFERYNELPISDFNQNQALQLLFDVKFCTVFCVRRENDKLIGFSQDICDKLRQRIDPFDLDVFYSYLQANVKRAAVQAQVILGCLLPSSIQIASLEVSERTKELDKEPSVLAVSFPSTNAWFPLLPITAPSQKILNAYSMKEDKIIPNKPLGKSSTKNQESGIMTKSNSSIFSGLASDWFS